ncbi:MAG TPA: hypothetical protein VF527_12725 [Pyrinomonadaceae bacterium]|jgi:hypothetical protein
MFRRPEFIPAQRAREWVAILLGGALLGLLMVWLQKSLQLNPRIVRNVLLAVAAISLCRFVSILIACVKELRRAEEEWAGRDGEDAD